MRALARRTGGGEELLGGGEKESPECFVSSCGDIGTGVGAAAKSSTVVRKP